MSVQRNRNYQKFSSVPSVYRHAYRNTPPLRTFGTNGLTGELENGLAYYVRANTHPRERAELRIAIKVGIFIIMSVCLFIIC